MSALRGKGFIYKLLQDFHWFLKPGRRLSQESNLFVLISSYYKQYGNSLQICLCKQTNLLKKWAFCMYNVYLTNNELNSLLYMITPHIQVIHKCLCLGSMNLLFLTIFRKCLSSYSSGIVKIWSIQKNTCLTIYSIEINL